MFGNEPNRLTSAEQFKEANLKETFEAVNTQDNTVKAELDKYYGVNGKSSTRRGASTGVVHFQGIDLNDSLEVKEKKLPPIPDGGFGWVVVVAAFYTSVCSDGLAFSLGNLQYEFINYFEQSYMKTSWIGSLFISVPLISGPIMSALVEQYGCRTMTMIASLVATSGFLLAAISNSVELLFLTFGVISGLAMGILCVTSVVAVAFWFDKRRTLAVALASCGIGFGIVMYGPLMEFLLSIYDWRGTLVILSCTVLNVCVCGALMRDPDWVIIKDLQEAKRKKALNANIKKSPSLASISIKSVGGDTIVLSLNEISDLLKSGHSPEHVISMLTSAVAESEELEAITQMNANRIRKRNYSTVDLPTFINLKEEVPPEVMDKVMSNKNLYNIIMQKYPHLSRHRRSEANSSFNSSSHRHSEDSGLHCASMKTLEPGDLSYNDYMSCGDVTIDNRSIVPPQADIPSKAMKDIKNNKVTELNTDRILHNSIDLNEPPIYRKSVVFKHALVNMPKHRFRTCSLPYIHKNFTPSLWSDSENEKNWYDTVIKILRENFNFKLFTEFHFLMFNIASLLLSIWSIIPFFFLKSYMSDFEVDGYSSIIITIGVSNGVGIVALGWLGDKPWYNVTKAYALCICICGASVAAYPFVIEDMLLLTVVSVIFGLSFASYFSYTPAILIELVPIDHFTVGYGMILLSKGIGSLIGPPIGGLIFDLSDRWDLVFFVGGAWLVISGLCVGTIAFTKNVRICGKDPLLSEVVAQSQAGPDKV